MLTRIRKAQEEREGGFTLIELLVVIIIIGILAAVAIPVFLSQRKKGYDAASKSELRNIATAQESYATDSVGNRYTASLNDLGEVGYVQSAPYQVADTDAPDTDDDIYVSVSDPASTTAPEAAWCAIVKHPSNPAIAWGQSNTSGAALKLDSDSTCTAGVLTL